MMMPGEDIQETAAAEARAYRDQDGCLWIDPHGDGNLFAFDSQCRRVMTEKWGLTSLELVAEKFGLTELVPADAERDADWGVRWRFKRIEGHPEPEWRVHEYGSSRDAAAGQRDKLNEAGFEARLVQRRSAGPAGEWKDAEGTP